MVARRRAKTPETVLGSVEAVLPIKDRNPTTRFPIVTILLLVLNVGVFLFIQQPVRSTAGGDVRFTYEYAAIPCEVVTGEPLSVGEVRARECDRDGDGATAEIFPDKAIWLAVVLSMFLHGGWLHLGGNMLFLWVFGNNIEDRLGAARYLLFYVLGGVVATVAHVAVDAGSTVPVVGASGAIAGVMGAYLVWFPNAPVLTAFIFILVFLREIAAKWLLGFWFVLQFFTGPDSGVAWMAHVGGFVFGALVALAVRASGTARKLAWRGHYARAGPPLPPPAPPPFPPRSPTPRSGGR